MKKKIEVYLVASNVLGRDSWSWHRLADGRSELVGYASKQEALASLASASKATGAEYVAVPELRTMGPTLEQASDGMREALVNVIRTTHAKTNQESSFLYRLAETAVDIYDLARRREASR